MERLSSSKLVSELQKAHQKIRQRSKRHRLLVDGSMRKLSEYNVKSLEDFEKKLTYNFNESEDMCILQNTDVFNFHKKKKSKEGFVTSFRQIYLLYWKSERRTSLADVAIEIISFIEQYFIEKHDGFKVTTSSTTVQEFSNYLLGLQRNEPEQEMSSLTSRLFKSAAAAIRFLDLHPLDMCYMYIWTETLHDLDLNNQDLAKLFDSNCHNV